MRRLMMLVGGAAVLVLGAPASAAAGGFVIDFATPPPSHVEVYGFTDCDGYCDSQPISITVERAGAIVGSSPTGTSARVPVLAQAGDVVRIFRDGVERATVAYDGGAVLDDPGCAPPGATVLSGTLRAGDPAAEPLSSPSLAGALVLDPQTQLIVFRGVEETPATLTGAGNRWRAELARPLERADVTFLNRYSIVTAVGTATVWAWRSVELCQPPYTPPPPYTGPPPAPPCSSGTLRAGEEFDAAARRAVSALRLKRVRRGGAALKDLAVCDHGLVSAWVRTTGRRPLVVARGSASTWGTRTTLELKRTRRAGRLAGRRTPVKVVLRFRDSAGKTLTWTRHVTLR
jgi:hypothetical protein